MYVSESPYRASVSETKIEATSARGQVTLHVAPKHTRLEIGAEVWTVANDHISVSIMGKRRAKTKSVLLRGARLFVAKAWPTNDTGLWIESRPGVVQRLFGLPPRIGMTEEVMDAWVELDKLTGALRDALQPYGGGASALEIGNGQHRAFVLEYSDRMVLYARPVFREKPRRVLELRADGSIVLPRRRKNDQVIAMEDGVKVIASGDRIYFCQPDGEQMAGVFLPWIGLSERKELMRRFQMLTGEPLKTSAAAGDNQGVTPRWPSLVP
jgi:hypothetical protein